MHGPHRTTEHEAIEHGAIERSTTEHWMTGALDDRALIQSKRLDKRLDDDRVDDRTGPRLDRADYRTGR